MPKNKDYPNKKDFQPRVDKNAQDEDALPLSDPAESNATKIFRENEGKEDEGADEQSAFGQNKEKN